MLGSGIGLIPEPNTNNAGCTIKVLVLPQVLSLVLSVVPEPNTNTAGCTIKVLVLPLETHQTELETELFKYNL